MTQQMMERTPETQIITDEEVKYNNDPSFDWDAEFDESGGKGDSPSSFQGI